METLWLDRPDAEAQLKLRAAGDVELEHVGASMIKDGFVVLPGVIAPERCESVVAEFDAYLASLGAEVESHKDAAGRLLRLVNFHLSAEKAAEVGTSPNLMRTLDFLFGEEAAIYSSLYFEYGTQQPIHRDSPFFETFPRNYFFGVWIALEDISPDAGPLMYHPGAHRFECDPHSIYNAVVEKMGGAATHEELINEALEQYYGEVIRTTEVLGTPLRAPLRKGDVAIWHPQLPHGGSPANDQSLTRRSMVFHCTPVSKQIYQQDVFFAHRGAEPAPRYGFREFNGRKLALSGDMAFQH